MAWESKGEEGRETVWSYVLQLNCDQQETLHRIYGLKISPFRGEWKTMDGLTFVNLRNCENVLNNLSLAVLKEMLGMGPWQYCIVRSYNREFESFLILALHYLPRNKICMYPSDETLLGSFLYLPWRDIGRRICSQPSISVDTYMDYLTWRAREGASEWTATPLYIIFLGFIFVIYSEIKRKDK